jgi:tetratricopeptide (TPR) repeat protein
MVRFLASLLAAAALTAAADQQTRLFERAVKELNSGNYKAAEKDLEQVLTSSPNHPGALQNLGLVYSRTGRLGQAILTYRHAVDLQPGDPKLLLELGLCYLKQDSFTEALPVFQKLMMDNPDGELAHNPDLLYLLTTGYLKKNPTPEGRRAAGTLLNFIPPAPASFVLCKIYFESGRYEEAEQQCRRTLAADAAFPGAHRELGKALVSQHSPDAEAELAAAVSQGPNDAVAAYYYGTALLQDGKMSEAAAQLERAQRLDPAFWGSYFYLGKIKLQADQPAQAVPLLRKAAELNPSAAVVFYELGRALISTGQTEEGERFMQHVRELRGEELQRDTQALHKK